jgi:hypothetical protein
VIQNTLEANGASDVSVSVTTPAGDTAYVEGQVPAVGTVTINEV